MQNVTEYIFSHQLGVMSNLEWSLVLNVINFVWTLFTCWHSQTHFWLIKVVNKNINIVQIDHQPDATIFQFIIPTFIYSSACFGRSPAHHQELKDCSSSLWFYLRIVVIAVLCSWSGRLSPRYEGKTRGCYCSLWAPDDGRENARNMLSCK